MARRTFAVVVSMFVLLVVGLAEGGTSAARSVAGTSTGGYVVTRVSNPARSIVSTAKGTWVATFTDGSRTVSLAGPGRTFSEPDVAATVRHATWVRLLPGASTGRVDLAWLDRARGDTSPDLLAVAFQYVTGAAAVVEGGAPLAGDASYGPLQADGTRQEGSDWNDFQQVSATYDGVADAAEAAQAGSLDCSGFVRMVLGRRLGVPMVLGPDGVRLPRRAVQMAASAPGTLTISDAGRQVSDFKPLAPGDLVLFDASADDGTAIDHVGFYLGRDGSGSHRFLSSRKGADGPTMGDVKGRSTLDGTGLYATAFRAARRI